MPLIWSIPDDFPQGLVGRYCRNVSPNRFEYRRGIALPADFGVPTFEFSAPASVLESWDVLPNDALLPLVGPRAAAVLLAKAAGDVQLFKAIVRALDGEVSGYRVINVTGTVSCIDHDASDYSIISGTNRIMSFRTLHFRHGCLGKRQLARDEEYKGNILVSDEVSAALVAARIRGVACRRPEEMDSP